MSGVQKTVPKDTTPRSPYIGSSRGHPKPVDYDVLSAKEGAKRHHPGRHVPYRLQNQGSSNTRGLRKMYNVLSAEDRAKRHHPWQTPYRL